MFVIRPILKRSQKHFADQQRTLGQLNGHIEEMFTGHQVVKAFGHEKKAGAEFDEVNEELYKAGSKAQFISGIIMPIMMFIGNISYVLISVVGGFWSRNAPFQSEIFKPLSPIPASSPSRSRKRPISRISFNRPLLQQNVYLSCWMTKKKRKENASFSYRGQKVLLPFEHVDFGYGEELLIRGYEHRT